MNDRNDRITRAYQRLGHNPALATLRLPAFYLGLDLGQTNDPTALAVLRRQTHTPNSRPVPQPDWVFDLGHLERFPLGTPYPAIVGEVGDRIHRLKTLASSIYLVVDATGVGSPVVDLFEEAGLEPWSLTYTSGHTVSKGSKPRSFNVPKRDLVSAAKVALQTQRLRISSQLELAPILRTEFKNFKVKISLKGSDTYEAWRSGDHDDLVLAVAQALWAAETILSPQGIVFHTIALPR